MMKLVIAALAACLLSAFPMLGASPSAFDPTRFAPPDEASFHLSAYMRDTSDEIESLNNPALLDVVGALGSAAARGSTELVRSLLSSAYPGLVAEMNALGYKTVWDPIEEEWVRVCCQLTIFDISLPSGVVRVESEEGTGV